MRKRERIELIKKIITENKIKTQNELLDKLEELSGMLITQATISRDMNEIGIVKIPLQDGSYVYSLPKKKEPKEEGKPILVQDVVRSISQENQEMPNMLGISVVPGNGKFLKRILLEKYADKVMAIIADDDSVLVIAQKHIFATEIRDEVVGWLRS